MASIRLDAMLREFGAPRSERASAGTVVGLIEELEARYPRLRLRLRDETGSMRPFVRVFVNGSEIRELNGLQTRLAEADQVEILHSIQGG